MDMGIKHALRLFNFFLDTITETLILIFINFFDICTCTLLPGTQNHENMQKCDGLEKNYFFKKASYTVILTINDLILFVI